MPRDTSPAFDAGLIAHVTEPVYLIEILTDVPFYWTTSAQVTWDSKTWLPSAARVEQIGEQGARVSLRNDNNTGSSLVLNNTLRDKECRIYLFYNGDAEELFRGFCSDSSVSVMSVAIDMLPSRNSNALIPRKRIAAPTFTHLPKLGEVIRWGTEFFKVTY